MSCSHCGSEKKIVGRGLCRPCYARLRTKGTLAKKNISRSGPCRIDGCEFPVFAKGFCARHYAQDRHPLYSTWTSLRSRYGADVCQEWQTFARFLADVGERPSPRHQFRRSDEGKPFSAENFRWLPPVPGGKRDTYSKQERSDYSRQWMLNKRYGLTVQDYAAMVAAQSGKCAICCEEEKFDNSRSGKKQDLSVDHCHRTNKVRGLLCVGCNRMIGYAKDNKDTLKSAIAYLERYEKEPEPWAHPPTSPSA
jgi:hypothetical protein